MSYLTGGVQKSVVTLSASALHNIKTTPVNITPAPPSGYMVVPVSVFGHYKFNTQAFGVGGSQQFVLMYNGRQPSPGLDGGYMHALMMANGYDTFGMFGPHMFYGANEFGGVQPIGSFGPSKQTGPFTLTSVDNNDGSGHTTYHGTFPGAGAANSLNSFKVTISGFTNSNNNGTFICNDDTANTNNALFCIVNNPNGVAETHAATMTINNFLDGAALQIGPAGDGGNAADGTPLDLGTFGGLGSGVTVASGGTGYNVGDKGLINGNASGTGAIYQVTTAPGGVVSAVSILFPGTNYDPADTGMPTTVITGTGDGTLTLNPGTIVLGNGTLEITCYYQVVPIP